MAHKNGSTVNGNNAGQLLEGDDNPDGGIPEGGGMVSWRSPSNIALVKYWGKKKGQLPQNPSLSITLSQSFTETTVKYSPSELKSGVFRQFSFEGIEGGPFAGRVKSYLKNIESLYPFLQSYDISIESKNSFPHSSGIASSASAMSSLALCITSMERQLYNSPSDDAGFFRKASYAARIGSGSAARSVYPGYVLWGLVPGIAGSANEFAVPVNDRIHDSLKEMNNAILVVDDTPKSVSSSSGHVLMQTHPWAAIRYQQAGENTERLLEVLAAGDLYEFITIVESEALTLHALMMSCGKGYMLMKPSSLAIIEKVREFRQAADIPLAFSLDAGPNVHLIYPSSFTSEVKEFIWDQLVHYCKSGKWIDDSAGSGPVEITPEK